MCEGPCFYCGVRSDVTCRHRCGIPRVAWPDLSFDAPKVDRRQFHNAWARNTRDGTMTTAHMTAQLKAMLQSKP